MVNRRVLIVLLQLSMELDLVRAVADALEGELMSVAVLFGDAVQLNAYLIFVD